MIRLVDVRLIEDRSPLIKRLWRVTGKARYVVGVLTGMVTIQFMPVLGGFLIACIVMMAMYGTWPNFD